MGELTSLSVDNSGRVPHSPLVKSLNKEYCCAVPTPVPPYDR